MTPCQTLIATGRATNDAWFPKAPVKHGKKIEHPLARAACGACAIADACRQGAIDRREEYGIWGGVDFGDRDERRAVLTPHKRHRNRIRPPKVALLGFAGDLRAARVAAGMSQDELAKTIGGTSTAVYLWESGKTVPGAKYAAALFDLFGVSAPAPTRSTDAA